MEGKIFGIGLSRTGTNTLTIALRHLGYSAVHYPDKEETMLLLMNGMFDIPEINEHDAVTDVQASVFYKNFDRQYPGSKFILTVRDKEEWLASTKRHFHEKERESRIPNNRFMRGGQVREAVVYSMWLRAATYKIVGWDREVFSDIYDSHHRDCMEYFKDRPNDLLIMDICAGNGWNHLCQFLGKPVPSFKFPYKVKKRLTDLS